MTVRYEFADAESGTLARISVAGEPGRLYRVTGPLMAPAVRRNLSRDLCRLEDRVRGQAGGGPGGASDQGARRRRGSA